MTRPSRRPKPAVLVLLLFYAAFNTTAALGWLAQAHDLPSLAGASGIARFCRSFAVFDHGYFDRVGQGELGIAALNVTLVEAIYLVLLAALLRGWAIRVALQIGVGAIVAYSVLFNWACAAIAEFSNMDEQTAASFAVFFGAGAPWLLGHLYFVADGWLTFQHRRTPVRRPGPARLGTAK